MWKEFSRRRAHYSAYCWFLETKARLFVSFFVDSFSQLAACSRRIQSFCFLVYYLFPLCVVWNLTIAKLGEIWLPSTPLLLRSSTLSRLIILVSKLRGGWDLLWTLYHGVDCEHLLLLSRLERTRWLEPHQCRSLHDIATECLCDGTWHDRSSWLRAILRAPHPCLGLFVAASCLIWV